MTADKAKDAAVEDEQKQTPSAEADSGAGEGETNTEDEQPKAKRGKAVNGGPAARVSVASWWCPNDDRSMPIDVARCDECGYERI